MDVHLSGSLSSHTFSADGWHTHTQIAMELDPLSQTSLVTISLLEARLLRLEHLLYGQSAVPSRPAGTSAVDSLADLERRFSSLISRFKVYADLLRICRWQSLSPWQFAKLSGSRTDSGPLLTQTTRTLPSSSRPPPTSRRPRS